MSRKSSLKLAITTLAVLLVADAPAWAAGSTSKTFTATAAVAAKCVMSNIATLDFGSYDPVVNNVSSDLPGNTSFTLTCTKNASPSIELNLGNNFGANVAAKRSMNNGTAGAGNNLSYDLYVPNGVGDSSTATPTASLWGDNTSGTTTFAPSVPSVAAQTITIFGAVKAGQDVPVGTYNDSVIATVNF